MLLGAETAPRLERTGVVRWGQGTRMRDLGRVGAEQVAHDFKSPDLDRVLTSLEKAPSKKDAKLRSPALLKAIARAWDRLYVENRTVPSQHVARVYTYTKANITADWLINLRERAWIAIGRGDLVTPAEAVVKTLETQTLYANSAFALELDLGDFSSDFANTLGLITSVRVSDEAQIMQIYRNIAKHVPRAVAWNSRVGDVAVQDLRTAFSERSGLVYVGGAWKSPGDLFLGKDIFHDRARFAPGGPAYASLWQALGIHEPDLDDCIQFLRALATKPYDVDAEAALIDVYRYMEPLLARAERRHRDKLKALPLHCAGGWQTARPVFLVDDHELRSQLSAALPDRQFWSPPCDLREMPLLVALTGVARCTPVLKVAEDRGAGEMQGDNQRDRFARAVDHLSDELARNDAETRLRMSFGWDELRDIPLFVYPGPVRVQARDDALAAGWITIQLQALITTTPYEMHVWEDALPEREYGGHAIASLFPPAARRGIEAEWVVAWQAGRERVGAAIRLASDEEHEDAMNETAAKINAAPKKKIAVSKPGGKGPAKQERKLKDKVGPILGAVVSAGTPPKPQEPTPKPKLHETQPTPKPTDPASRAAPTAYTQADLEQRGWELLVQALETSAEEELVDFRSRHGVGADGTINWKTFVEMKATARAAQNAIEMSNAEYERAKERGIDFILALVSGLEDGYQDEVRLILDPANRATVRPLNGVKLVALSEAPSILIPFGQAEDED
jgi:hypothetical protein